MSSGWCPDHAICIEWIDRRAVELVENFQDVDTVYMSLDIYKQFMESALSNMRFSSAPTTTFPTVVKLNLSVCEVTVVPIPFFSNFCHVGTNMTYEQLEWQKIGQDFEDAILKESP